MSEARLEIKHADPSASGFSGWRNGDPFSLNGYGRWLTRLARSIEFMHCRLRAATDCCRWTPAIWHNR
jgi:hypothetical protein